MTPMGLVSAALGPGFRRDERNSATCFQRLYLMKGVTFATWS